MTKETKTKSAKKIEQQNLLSKHLKKSVGAIHSSGKLTLVQKKLANILLYSAYDNLLKVRTHSIPLSIMCSMLGWEVSNRIEYLKEALVALQSTILHFNLREDGGEVWESMSMLSYAKIKNGICTYRYDEALAEKLYDPAMFAMINLQVQRRIDGSHALNLYENCVRYKDTYNGSTGVWSLELFREIIGATSDYYADFRKLNAKIIKPSISNINEVSDIIINVEYEKQNRKVVGIKFFVRNKTEEEMLGMQKSLPGLSFKESIANYQEMSDSEAFLALRKHGISERLAVTWIRDVGESKILEIVAYTEKRDASHQIKTNTRAYIQGLVKIGADVEISEYDKEKLQQLEIVSQEEQNKIFEEKLNKFKEKYRNEVIREFRKNLTLEERNNYIKKWFLTEAGQGKEHDYDFTNGKFRTLVNNVAFEFSYLPKQILELADEEGFLNWLQQNNEMMFHDFVLSIKK